MIFCLLNLIRFFTAWSSSNPTSSQNTEVAPLFLFFKILWILFVNDDKWCWIPTWKGMWGPFWVNLLSQRWEQRARQMKYLVRNHAVGQCTHRDRHIGYPSPGKSALSGPFWTLLKVLKVLNDTISLEAGSTSTHSSVAVCLHKVTLFYSSCALKQCTFVSVFPWSL